MPRFDLVSAGPKSNISDPSKILSFSRQIIMNVVIAVIGLLACLFIGTREGSTSLLDNDCGIVNNDIILNRIKNCVGGNDADKYSNPWMVLVISTNMLPRPEICGGSLITSRFVLTAAHCIFNDTMKVRLGDFDAKFILEDCSSGVCIPKKYEIDVHMKFVHSEFSRISAKNDIGLLRMAQSVPYSDYVRPICLLVNEQVGRITSFNITGWGETKDSEHSNTLQVATVNRIDPINCRLNFGTDVDTSQICAAGWKSDACSGDSGGPLSAGLSYGGIPRVFQFGIISYGLRSCLGLGAYTNVKHFTGWIVDVVAQYT